MSRRNSFATPVTRPRRPELTIQPVSRRRRNTPVLRDPHLALRMFQQLNDEILNYMHARTEFLPIPGLPYNHPTYRRFAQELLELHNYIIDELRTQVYEHEITSEELFHEITSTLAMNASSNDEFSGFYRALNAWWSSNSSRLQRQQNINERMEMSDTRPRNLFHDEL